MQEWNKLPSSIRDITDISQEEKDLKEAILLLIPYSLIVGIQHYTSVS